MVCESSATPLGLTCLAANIDILIDVDKLSKDPRSSNLVYILISVISAIELKFLIPRSRSCDYLFACFFGPTYIGHAITHLPRLIREHRFAWLTTETIKSLTSSMGSLARSEPRKFVARVNGGWSASNAK